MTPRRTVAFSLLSLFGGLSLVAAAIGCNGNPPATGANARKYQPAGESSVAAAPPTSIATNPSAEVATKTAGQASDSPNPEREPAAGNQPPQDDPIVGENPGEPQPEPIVLVAKEPEHPFARRAPLLEIFGRDIFPKDAEWLNTSGPLKLKDLEGKFVILDFWTYCCINCMHILPELKKLEQRYPNELVVIGVHTAKFDGEKDSKNIAEAILRYEIEHPVVNDPDHKLWTEMGVNSWPTTMLIDPQGNLVRFRPGEFKAEEYIEIIDAALPYYEKVGALDRTPLRFDLLADRAVKTPLRFPGKVLADEAGGRLFITDSNHNRIVVTTLEGSVLDVIGTGAEGRKDGAYDVATFDHPQGCALVGEMLYVADTENHLIRKIDLKQKQVKTIAGIGEQAKSGFPGLETAQRTGKIPDRWVGRPSNTAIASPWALWVHEKDLYIAMAGPHQIWKMPLNEREIGPYAGNGREDIVDGPLLPREPYALGFSSFAQPSGLTSDGTWLYIADSEGSSIRAVPFDPKNKEGAKTVIGTSNLSGGRLFAFGDVDGPKTRAKLQHPLGVAYQDGTIYVADTYNNKIKAVDAKTGEVKTVAGQTEAGKTDDPPAFDEPAGLSLAGGKLYIADTNNHAIRVLDLASGKVSTLNIEGLKPAETKPADKRPDFAKAASVKGNALTLKPENGQVTLNLNLQLPVGWKINTLAPASYYVDEVGDAGLIDAAALGKQALETPTAQIAVKLPAKSSGTTTVKVSMNYYYCQDLNGLCKVGSVVFEQPLTISNDGTASSVDLVHVVKE